MEATYRDDIICISTKRKDYENNREAAKKIDQGDGAEGDGAGDD
jgi:hypothetical protein